MRPAESSSMVTEDSNEFFGHLNQPATPRRQRRPSDASLHRPPQDAQGDVGSGDFRQVPDPFEAPVDVPGEVPAEEVAGDHPLNSSGQSAMLPERGRARTRSVRGPGLSPGIPKIHEQTQTRSVPRSGVVLTPGGVKRVDDKPTTKQTRRPASRQVPAQPEKDPSGFHEESRQKNDNEDVSWEEYAADGFPAMAAEEFGVKARRTDTGRVVPVAVRSDLTEEALKGRSIKGGGRGARRPVRAAAQPKAAPKSLWGRIGQSLRLKRPDFEAAQEAADEGDAPAAEENTRRRGFARSGSLPTKKRGGRKTPLGMAWSVAVEVGKILLLVLLLRAYVVQVSQVQGPSMEGTLVHGDRLVVERITPMLANNRDKWWISWMPEFMTPELHRGDIVVIRSPEDPGLELVKRLIALPGDTLKFEDGKLWLREANGQKFAPVPESYLTADELKQADGTYRSFTSGDLGSAIREGEEFQVPPARIFVMGDNRTHSNDSRRWLEIDVRQTQPPGVDRLWAHASSIEGRVIFRIWPFDRIWPPVK